jgi:hypothetical protein
LTLLHDPQTGIIARDQIPPFLKSVRCEMATFYQANALLRAIFLENMNESVQLLKKAASNVRDRDRLLQRAEAARERAVLEGRNFPVSPELFGGIFLDLKVLDTLGMGAGDTNLANKSGRDATHTVTWAGAPTLNTQNTYEMNFSFLIDQRSGLAQGNEEDPFRCYAPDLAPGTSPVTLARDAAPGAARFTRILVNGATPLAAWLMENSDQAWENFHAMHADLDKEGLIPVQMNYSFTVQITAGLDVRYSLTSPIWSPLQVGGVASSVQTSQMSIYVNGDDANLAGGAKLGQAVNGVPKADGTAPGTPYVQEGDIGKQAKIKIATLTAQLKETEATISSKGLSDETVNQRQSLQAQLKAWQDVQEALKTAKSAVVVRPPIYRAPAGNRRGYLNSPVGIAPPQ